MVDIAFMVTMCMIYTCRSSGEKQPLNHYVDKLSEAYPKYSNKAVNLIKQRHMHIDSDSTITIWIIAMHYSYML